jgi:hypothetical protein
VTGGALLAASMLAGWLWMKFGPQTTFEAGAGFSIAALFGLISRSSRDPDRG